jgi:predicted HTH transcriptional regulator
MLTATDLWAVMKLNHELPNVEFKCSGDRTDKAFFATVARACIGMSNRRDGGYVVIGIEDDDALGSPGLTPSRVTQWLDFDSVSDALHAYAEPVVSFELGQIELPSGAIVVVIDVREFDKIPTLCAKNYGSSENRLKLIKGAIYIRSARKGETTPFPSQYDMRELLDLMTEKAVRDFLERAGRVGLDSTARRQTDDDLFEAQLEDFR